ncbi:hypothetical protein Tco_1169382 [Tanacetum coccineum]
MVLDRIKSFPRGTSCRRDELRVQHLIDCLSGSAVAVSNELVSSITQVVNLFLDRSYPKMLGEYIFSAPLTPLVKPGGGIHPINMGTVWRRIVSKVSGGSGAILHAVNRLIEGRGDDVGLSMFVGWNSVTLTQLDCITGSIPYGHAKGCSRAWYLDDGTIVGDTLVVGKAKEDPQSRLTGVFPSNIARPSHGVKLLGGPASVDFDFCSQLVMKRVAKTIKLMDAVAKINDPQCELLLLRSCMGSSKLYFSMHTCSPCVFESVQCYFDVALCSSLERIVTASGLGDVLNYAFLASQLQFVGLQTKLLRHTDIVASGPNFDDALRVFNTSMETDFLSNPSEIAAPNL